MATTNCYYRTKSGKCYHKRDCSRIKASKDIRVVRTTSGLKPCLSCCAPAAVPVPESKTEGRTLIMDTEGTAFVTQIAAVDLDTGEFYTSRPSKHTRLRPVSSDWVVEEHRSFLKFAGSAEPVTVIFHNSKHDVGLLDGCLSEAVGVPSSFFPKSWRVLDSVHLFRLRIPGLKDYKLGTCVRASVNAKPRERTSSIIKRTVSEVHLRDALLSVGKMHNALVDAGLLRVALLVTG